MVSVTFFCAATDSVFFNYFSVYPAGSVLFSGRAGIAGLILAPPAHGSAGTWRSLVLSCLKHKTLAHNARVSPNDPIHALNRSSP